MNLMFAAALAVFQLVPWTGAPVASPYENQFRLTVIGPASTTVHLEARRVTPGWIATFCTAKICSPRKVDVVVPRSGRAIVRFDLIRTNDAASKRAVAVVAGGMETKTVYAKVR